jgi:hypothetical protein
MTSGSRGTCSAYAAHAASRASARFGSAFAGNIRDSSDFVA